MCILEVLRCSIQDLRWDNWDGLKPSLPTAPLAPIPIAFHNGCDRKLNSKCLIKPSSSSLCIHYSQPSFSSFVSLPALYTTLLCLHFQDINTTVQVAVDEMTFFLMVPSVQAGLLNPQKLCDIDTSPFVLFCVARCLT